MKALGNLLKRFFCGKLVIVKSKKRFFSRSIWHGILTSSHFSIKAGKVMPWTKTTISITRKWYFGNNDWFCKLALLKVFIEVTFSWFTVFCFYLIKLLRLTSFTNFVLSPFSLFDNFHFPFSCMKMKKLLWVLSLV